MDVPEVMQVSPRCSSLAPREESSSQEKFFFSSCVTICHCSCPRIFVTFHHFDLVHPSWIHGCSRHPLEIIVTCSWLMENILRYMSPAMTRSDVFLSRKAPSCRQQPNGTGGSFLDARRHEGERTEAQPMEATHGLWHDNAALISFGR